MTTAALPIGGPAFVALMRRELARFFRQPSRVIASVGTPALLWLFLAAGFADSFARPGAAPPAHIASAPGGAPATTAPGYAAFLLPGVATAVILFSSIFAAMSLIEDRREGFLQSALASPAPAWSIVGAKAIGGAIIGAIQAALVLAAAPVVGLRPGAGGLALALLALALTSVALTCLGLAAAWWVNSSEGFHGVMNLALMPMWLLSGAFFPAEGAAGWLRALMAINPLRWATDAVRAPLEGRAREAGIAWVVTVVFAAAMAGLAAMTMRRGKSGRRA